VSLENDIAIMRQAAKIAERERNGSALDLNKEFWSATHYHCADAEKKLAYRKRELQKTLTKLKSELGE
jgi:hypothetical protein